MNSLSVAHGVYRKHRNSRCVYCNHIGFSTEFPDEPVKHPSVCSHCRNAGRTMPEQAQAWVSQFGPDDDPEPDPAGPAPAAVTFGGQAVTAPGFTQDQFERAMVRAMVDELGVHEDRAGGFIVSHKGVNGGYLTSRSSCTCPAGTHNTPCKHRAMLIFHLDIRKPAIRKAWQETNRIVAERRATTAA